VPVVVLFVVFGQTKMLLATLPVLLVHEWAHVLTANALGMKITQMELLPFGCAAKMSSFAMTRSREIIVAAAGPAANMVFACAVFLADEFFFSIEISRLLISTNIAIAAVNLLPALPLDGGRIARAAFSSYLGTVRATKVTAVMGVVFSAVLLGVGVLIVIDGTVNLSFFVMGAFLCIAAIKEMKSVPYVLIRDFSGKRAALQKRKTMCVNRFVAMRSDKVSEILREFESGKYNVVTVLDQNLGVVFELDEKQIMQAVMQKGLHVTLVAVHNMSAEHE